MIDQQLYDLLQKINGSLNDMKRIQQDTLDFFKSIEERSLGEEDSQKYLDELGKEKFHPPMG